MDGITPERPERSEERPARGGLCLLLGRLALAAGRRSESERKTDLGGNGYEREAKHGL